MKLIPVLDKADILFAEVDDSDAEYLSKWTWRAHRATRSATTYARGYVGGQRVLMHRLVLGDEAGPITDHIDGNGLNNQRVNLRSVTQRENVIAGYARKAFDQYEDRL